MGVFLGDSKNTSATTCALKMNYMMVKVLRPEAEAKFPSLKEKGFTLRHGLMSRRATFWSSVEVCASGCRSR